MVELGRGEKGVKKDVDDVLDLPEDLGDVGPAVSGEEGYFVPPTKGTAPSQVQSTCTCTCMYLCVWVGLCRSEACFTLSGIQV